MRVHFPSNGGGCGLLLLNWFTDTYLQGSRLFGKEPGTLLSLLPVSGLVMIGPATALGEEQAVQQDH